MDHDSSTKFISSLAKFLQSLCNGYVEFDSGVQVIGHLYLSVDTGKTVDYILNEKVCKTDENSVTFISNSFHAQPAEKPKPPGKKTGKDPDTKIEDNGSESNQVEPRSTNFGTVPSHNSPHSQGGKRPHSPSVRPTASKSGRSSPRHKKSRTESSEQPQISNPASENSISSAPSPADGAPVNTENSDGQYEYQQGFFHPGDDENSMAEDTEERDIKPSIDTDVTFIKEEYAPSSSCSQTGGQNRDRSHGDDSSTYPSAYQSNQVFPGVGFSGQAGFGASGSSRSNYGAGDRTSNMFGSLPGTSQMESGDNSGDPSVLIAARWKKRQPNGRSTTFGHELSSFLCDAKYCPPKKMVGRRVMPSSSTQCKKCTFVSRDPLAMAMHKKSCTGKRHLTCNVCFKILSRYDALAEHMRGIHGIGNKVECRFCGKNFKYRPQMYQHQAICVNRPPKIDIDTAFPAEPQVGHGEMDTKLSFSYDVSMPSSFDMSINQQMFTSQQFPPASNL